MRSFHRLTLWTVIAVYALILVGGIVRSTGSGMGCPDWPRCFGRWVPPTSIDELPADYKEYYAEYRNKKNIRFARYLSAIGLNETAEKLLTDERVREENDFNATRTWIEYINRVIGVIIGFLIFAVAVLSFRLRKADPAIFVIAVTSLILVGFQGWLGSFVVSSNLTPWTVTVHMFLALLIVFLLIVLYHRSGEGKIWIAKGIGYVPILACLFVLLIQILLGTQVREALDQIALQWPRAEWISQAGQDFVIHRSFSWVIVIIHAWLIITMLRTNASRPFSVAVVVLILGTVFSGMGMAYAGVPPFLQPVHLLFATLAFGVLTMLLMQEHRINLIRQSR